MIKGFNQEDFMSQPLSVDVTQETQYACDCFGNTVAAFPTEQTIMIAVGGTEYDVRDLVWRLLRAEEATYDLQTQVAQLLHRIEELERDNFKLRF